MSNLQLLLDRLAQIETVSSVETAPLGAERAELIGTTEGLTFICSFPVPNKTARSESYYPASVYEDTQFHDLIAAAVTDHIKLLTERYSTGA